MENEIKDSRGDAERQRAQSETLVDIVAEMQNFARVGRGHEGTCSDLIESYADRIEATYKRDIEKLNSVIQATVSRSDAEIDRLRREVAELRKQIGNAAAMREALEHVEKLAREFAVGNYYVSDFPKMLLDAIQPALAKPPRQCDVGTAEEQTRRFADYCARHRHTDLPRCAGCPLENLPSGTGCEEAWAQLPYNESEAGK